MCADCPICPLVLFLFYDLVGQLLLSKNVIRALSYVLSLLRVTPTSSLVRHTKTRSNPPKHSITHIWWQALHACIQKQTKINAYWQHSCWRFDTQDWSKEVEYNGTERNVRDDITTTSLAKNHYEDCRSTYMTRWSELFQSKYNEPEIENPQTI